MMCQDVYTWVSNCFWTSRSAWAAASPSIPLHHTCMLLQCCYCNVKLWGESLFTHLTELQNNCPAWPQRYRRLPEKRAWLVSKAWYFAKLLLDTLQNCIAHQEKKRKLNNSMPRTLSLEELKPTRHTWCKHSSNWTQETHPLTDSPSFVSLRPNAAAFSLRLLLLAYVLLTIDARDNNYFQQSWNLSIPWIHICAISFRSRSTYDTVPATFVSQTIMFNHTGVTVWASNLCFGQQKRTKPLDIPLLVWLTQRIDAAAK